MHKVNNVSFHVHGRKEHTTIFLLSSLREIFKKNQIFYCTFDNFNRGEIKILKYLRINYFTLKDIGDYKEFSKFNINFLRHNYSIFKSLIKSKKKYAVKLRSDVLINRNIYQDIQDCIESLSNYSNSNETKLFKNNFLYKKIITHSYLPYYKHLYVADQIQFSERKFLLKYYFFGCEENKILKLEDLHALPNPLHSKNKIYLANEQIQVLTFIKNILKNKKLLTDILFDEQFNKFFLNFFIISKNFRGINLPIRIDPRMNLKRLMFEIYKSQQGCLSKIFGFFFYIKYYFKKNETRK
jgi:hypothetical protein